MGKNKGKNNGNWKGGVSEYPNHYLMKKNKLIKLEQCGNKCEICGKEAEHIHHIDCNKSNHKLSNLKLLCCKCHSLIHAGRKNKTSKFMRLYGMTLKEMANKFGGDPTTYYRIHKERKLKFFLDSYSCAR